MTEFTYIEFDRSITKNLTRNIPIDDTWVEISYSSLLNNIKLSSNGESTIFCKMSICNNDWDIYMLSKNYKYKDVKNYWRPYWVTEDIRYPLNGSLSLGAPYTIYETQNKIPVDINIIKIRLLVYKLKSSITVDTRGSNFNYKYSDITIRSSDDKDFRCHKMILSSNKYFECILECDIDNCVKLNIHSKYLQRILDSIYSESNTNNPFSVAKNTSITNIHTFILDELIEFINHAQKCLDSNLVHEIEDIIIDNHINFTNYECLVQLCEAFKTSTKLTGLEHSLDNSLDLLKGKVYRISKKHKDIDDNKSKDYHNSEKDEHKDKEQKINK